MILHSWLPHIYKEIWEAAVVKILRCKRQLRNAADRYAVAVCQEGQNNHQALIQKVVMHMFGERRNHLLYSDWKTKIRPF